MQSVAVVVKVEVARKKLLIAANITIIESISFTFPQKKN